MKAIKNDRNKHCSLQNTKELELQIKLESLICHKGRSMLKAIYKWSHVR